MEEGAEGATSASTSESVSAVPTFVDQHLICRKCGNETTPMRLNVVAYFSNYFQETNAKKTTTKNNKRVKPKYYGECLTRDEMMERIAEEEQKRLKKATKKSKIKQSHG